MNGVKVNNFLVSFLEVGGYNMEDVVCIPHWMDLFFINTNVKYYYSI